MSTRPPATWCKPLAREGEPPNRAQSVEQCALFFHVAGALPLACALAASITERRTADLLASADSFTAATSLRTAPAQAGGPKRYPALGLAAKRDRVTSANVPI